jgi:hypothetical protein
VTRGILVLDAGGVLGLAHGDHRAWARLAVALEMGLTAIVPTPVVAQVHRGGRRGRAVDQVLDAVGHALPTSDHIARTAGELLGAAGGADAVDAIVVAEALAAQPAAILTSDPTDLARLLDGQADRPRVSILGV